MKSLNNRRLKFDKRRTIFQYHLEWDSSLTSLPIKQDVDNRVEANKLISELFNEGVNRITIVRNQK